ncbi:hypothetical protein F5Y10DRAFT_292730 [Nemania abortiva]|nr:hypothetical protein F5Y10DRAFT_292730 [Nemania abortiva]
MAPGNNAPLDADSKQIQQPVENNEDRIVKKQKKTYGQIPIDNSHCVQHQTQEWDIDKKSWRTWCLNHPWCPFKGRPRWVRWTVLTTFSVVIIAVLLAGIIFGTYYVSSANFNCPFSLQELGHAIPILTGDPTQEATHRRTSTTMIKAEPIQENDCEC